VSRAPSPRARSPRGGCLLAALLLLAACKGRSSAPAATATAAPPADARLLYAAGKNALATKRLDDAIDAFTRAAAAAADPELHANAWLGLGAAYGERGDHAHAIAAWEQVTVLRPDDPDAWRVLAEGEAQAGKRDRQAQALEHVIALDPDDLAAYLELGGLDAQLGKGAQAKDVYVRYEARRRDAVVTLGKDKDPEARAHAAEELGGARDAGTARALVLALTDKEPAVRAACARSLARIGVDVDKDVRPALQLLRDRERNPDVLTALDEALQ
jgi:tetratricopeptide (TPR) repeat protein